MNVVSHEEMHLCQARQKGKIVVEPHIYAAFEQGMKIPGDAARKPNAYQYHIVQHARMPCTASASLRVTKKANLHKLLPGVSPQ